MKTEEPFKVLLWLRALRDRHAEARARMSAQEKAADDLAAADLAKQYEERARRKREAPVVARVAEKPAGYGHRN